MIKNILNMVQSPWGNGGSNDGSNQGPSGGGKRPPNIDDLAGQFQDSLKKMFPRRSELVSRRKKTNRFIYYYCFALWLGSGFYRVLPDEQGVVLRFGKFTTLTQPGLNYHLPYPIETALTPKVTRVNRIDVGYRSASDTGRATSIQDVPEESLMLTGDENIVDIDYSVFWIIKDGGKFLFNIQDPEETVKSVAETAMREVIARNPIQTVLTGGRAQIENDTQKIMQEILDSL